MNDYTQPTNWTKEEVESSLRKMLQGHPDSELWGEHGLIAATMRDLVGYEKFYENQKERGFEEFLKCVSPVKQCENCGLHVDISKDSGVHKNCNYIYGRRGWRQLGAYDG